ncbi:hypothetical protein [Pantoea stewartii]|uniref:hypothetical protein n=1 Tax=Pantoea stewartii TaxID=66269 RepID=UPI0025A27555|nr:hypothetical protein [Pantoea stewartii]
MEHHCLMARYAELARARCLCKMFRRGMLLLEWAAAHQPRRALPATGAAELSRQGRVLSEATARLIDYPVYMRRVPKS